MRTSQVTVVDLRGRPGSPDGLAGGVVVVDHAKSLVRNADVYLSIVGGDMVTAVVCVAVGESTTDSTGVALSVPPALRHATVLWVGDCTGVRWAPRLSSPRPVDHPGDALASLLAALRVPAVFEHVVELAGELATVAANPGIRLVSGSADVTELVEASTAAIESLCAAPEHAVSRDLDAAIRQSYLANVADGVTLSGPLQTARAEALRRLDDVDNLARALGSPAMLVGSAAQVRDVGGQIVWAGQAVETYRRGVAESLNRMDGHLQVGHPSIDSVVELGVPTPRPADRGEITADLRRKVDARLDDGAALHELAHELRVVAANSGPQGCTAALDRVRSRGPIELAVPKFRKWPLRLTTLPMIILSCAALALLLGPGWPGMVAGGLLAVAWFGLGWLLLGRRLGREDEPGLAPALLGYGLPAVAGAVAGVVVGQLLGGLGIPTLVGQILVVGIVLLCLLVVVLNWHSAAREWRRELRVADLRAAVDELTRTVEDVTAREWQPMRRRQAIAAAAAEVAAGLEEIAETLARNGNQPFTSQRSPAHRIDRPVPPQLYAVIRADLLDVCRTALEPAWPAAETAVRTRDGVYARRLAGLLGEYSDDVRDHGLIGATRFSRDHRPRDAWMASVWSESPAALAALSSDVDGEMTQLCRGGQLGFLSTGAEPGMVRFAPRRLRRVLEKDGLHASLAADLGIVWSEGGEFVGALRLLPLRPESVRHVLGGVQ